MHTVRILSNCEASQQWLSSVIYTTLQTISLIPRIFDLSHIKGLGTTLMYVQAADTIHTENGLSTKGVCVIVYTTHALWVDK